MLMIYLNDYDYQVHARIQKMVLKCVVIKCVVLKEPEKIHSGHNELRLLLPAVVVMTLIF